MISSSHRSLPDNTQHSQQINIPCPDGIRTHNLSKLAAAHLHIRPRGHCDRQLQILRHLFLFLVFHLQFVYSYCGPNEYICFLLFLVLLCLLSLVTETNSGKTDNFSSSAPLSYVYFPVPPVACFTLEQTNLAIFKVVQSVHFFNISLHRALYQLNAQFFICPTNAHKLL